MDKTQKKRAGVPLGAILLLIFAAGVAVFAIWGVWRAAYPPVAPMQGQMEARIINISSKVPGRVARVLFKEGDFVEAGQAAALMSLPDIEAKLSRAKAGERAVGEKKSMIDEGARVENIRAARADWEAAAAEAAMAAKTYERLAALFKDGLVSRERYDEARARSEAASAEADALKEKYELAEAGARPQEKLAVADEKAGAEAAVAEVASFAEDTVLRAPRAGQVERVVLTEGEMAGAGFPVLTIVNLAEQYAVFNILEEDMPGVKIGATLKASVPAIARDVDFIIYYISPRANYATWRSTRQNSGYDMKTFEVRARPAAPEADLRPGMSVLVAR